MGGGDVVGWHDGRLGAGLLATEEAVGGHTVGRGGPRCAGVSPASDGADEPGCNKVG